MKKVIIKREAKTSGPFTVFMKKAISKRGAKTSERNHLIDSGMKNFGCPQAAPAPDVHRQRQQALLATTENLTSDQDAHLTASFSMILQIRGIVLHQEPHGL
jgi:hypothetical protein